MDSAGNLYGTTTLGGGCCGSPAQGTIFKIGSNGAEGLSDAFYVGNGGLYPTAGVILDANGNSYTTTLYGGNDTDPRCDPSGWSFYGGCGTVSQGVDALYSFCSATNCTDGAFPSGGLKRDAAGNLYGTTSQGGANFSANGGAGAGTVFKFDSTGQYSVLYSFCSVTNCADGSSPSGTLIQDVAGNLYGITSGGGAYGNGTVFRLDPSGHEKVLYNFCSAANCADGAGPVGIIRDAVGNFYGATGGGGNSGYGTVFKLDKAGHETVLYSFCSAANCADGASPPAGVIQDAAGSLYGTTTWNGNAGGGTAFRLDKAGNLTVLHTFCFSGNCADGANPAGGLIQDAGGYLYGTTFYGGRYSQHGPAYGYGAVFRIDTHLKVAGITLTSSVNPSLVDQPLILSAEVAGQSEIPTGVVTFQEGNTVLGTATLHQGTAKLRTQPARAGAFGITAQYAGDLYNLPARVALKQVVNRRITKTNLASSLNPSTNGQPVRFTSTVVSEGGPSPTGHVAFMNGNTLVGNAAVNNGVAQIEVSTLPVGTLSITAIYRGDTANLGSTSRVLKQVVH
jgi:uncharacterized repeat protein (TIGR03803 family)